jgi:amino acid transporter
MTAIRKLFKKEGKAQAPNAFGTFAGVFTPTVLTILGVIMYLRQGWVVGNAGIVGALAIVMIAVVITLCTGLSMSSITTNIRIGAGGAFSIISQSLGLEMGGSVGIPFFFSQALAVAMYIFGFREGVQWLFPGQNALLVDMATFGLIFGIALISTSFAFRIQFLILAIILASLVSIYGALFTHELNFEFQWFGHYPGSPENNYSGSSFWVVFAVFFPAVTGVMAGANMSGELKNPRRSIPRGTMAALILTSLIYISLVLVVSLLATPDELVSNYTILIDKSLFKPVVIAGLLGATFSSALTSLVGAPRVLQAMGEKNLLPASQFLRKTSRRGEPRNAMWITSLIVVVGLALRNLNMIAPLITMFFIITYCMINVVILIEQSLGLPSYRPTLRVPIVIPLIGSVGCLGIMFVINAFAALAALILIVLFYSFLLRKKIRSEAGDSRSGLFTALAEWATKQSNQLSPIKVKRAWQPDLLIPVATPKEIRGSYKLIHSLVYPKGSIKLAGLSTQGETVRLKAFIPLVQENFAAAGIYTTHTFVEGENFTEVVSVSMQALSAAFFKPNTILISLGESPSMDAEYEKVFHKVSDYRFGAYLYVPFDKVGIGLEKTINLWLRDIPESWDTLMELGNNDLAILSGLLLRRNWKGKLNVIAWNENPGEAKITPESLSRLFEFCRMPKEAEWFIIDGTFESSIGKIPNSDLQIMAMHGDEKMADLRIMANLSRTSWLFTIDSGNESCLV